MLSPPFARALYLPRHHYRKSVSSGGNRIIWHEFWPKNMSKIIYDNRVRPGYPFMIEWMWSEILSLRPSVRPDALLIHTMSEIRCSIYWHHEGDQIFYLLTLSETIWSIYDCMNDTRCKKIMRVEALLIDTMSDTRCSIYCDREWDSN